MTDSDSALAWLERSQQLLKIAVAVDDPTARQDILELAAKWASMAERKMPPPVVSTSAPAPVQAANEISPSD